VAAASIVAVLLLGFLGAVNPTNAAETAYASTPSAICTTTPGGAQNGVEVAPSHGKVFYIDSGQGQRVDAAYVGYQVKNTSGTDRANLWAKLDSFTGGVVGLANARDAVYRVGDVSAAATQPAFFLLQAATSSTRAQSHVLRVYSGDPRLSGSAELYSCSYTFVSVKETIKAAANKVTALTSVSANRVGGDLVVTVSGQTGTIGSGTSSPDREVLWFTPAAQSSWPSSSLVLKRTSIVFATNNGGNQNVSTHVNRLVFQNPRTTLLGASSKYFYEATYTFAIVGPVPASVRTVPIAQISSGTQIKHTDVGGITALAGSALSISTPVTVGVNKTVSSTVVGTAPERLLDYTVTLTNTAAGAVALDKLVDDPPVGLAFKTGSARYNNSVIPNPSTDSTGNLIFQGPFTVEAQVGSAVGSATLTYQMQIVSPCSLSSETFSFSNAAFATVGGLVVGRDSSTLSGVTISGSCPPTTGTVATANQTIAPQAITQPASAIGQTSATLNGSIDPNSVVDQPVVFQWGTSPTLSSPTTITLAPSTNAADFYGVLSSLTGLTSGTRYYHRVMVGNVSGEILSFTTTETPGTPTVATDAVTSIIQGTGSNGTAVLNGTIDPNQIATTPSFVWGLSGNAGAEGFCTNASYTLSGTVMEDTDDNGSLDANVILSGAFPAQVSLDVSGLSQGKFYCVKARGTPTASATIEGSPVLFRIAAVEPQAITFPTPSLSGSGSTTNLGAATTSSLAIRYSSNTPEACTVAGNVVTYVSGGTCSLSADQAGNTAFSAADTVTISFTVPTHTLLYNLNGGTGSPPVDSSSPYVRGATVNVSATPPNHASLFFAGWNTAADGSGTLYASAAQFGINADTVLYAQWSASVSFTVTYDANGAVGVPPASSSHSSGASPTLVSTAGGLSRPGFTFDGWTVAANTGSPVTSVTMSANTIVFARWVAQVTYNANGSSSGSVPTDSTQYLPGSSATVGANSGTLVRTGFIFSGWNTLANGAGTSFQPSASFAVTGATQLFAQWRSSVTYSANGAAGGVAPIDATSYAPGASLTILGNTGNLTRANFVFDGWNTLPNGNGTAYRLGDVVTNTGNLVVHAQWLAEVVVTFNGNGNTGGNAPDPQTTFRGQTVTVPTNTGALVRDGFTFRGWSLRANGGAILTPGSGTFTPSGDTTVYAAWQVVTAGVGGNPAAPPSVQPSPVLRPPANTPGNPVTPPSRVIPVTPPSAPVAVPSPAPQGRPATVVPTVPTLPGLRALTQAPGVVNGSGVPSSGAIVEENSTLDLGAPGLSAGEGNGQQPGRTTSSSAGLRTVSELAQESLQGFTPGASTRIEILGARTGARFVVSETSLIDQVTLIRAIEASVPAQAANFFSIESVRAVDQPLVPPAWTREERTGVTEFFAGAGLPEPKNLGDLNLQNYANWLLVTAKSSSYAPGTLVYLTLTSEPLILGSAVVGKDGTATLSGTIPVEFLTAGEHRVRLVGIRALDGAFVDGEGEIQVTAELLSEIERFDLGTQATIAVIGENTQGANHVAMRIIPLIPVAPWWTLWFILAGVLLSGAARLVPLGAVRVRRVASIAIGVAALLPAVILGWLSTVTLVAWWGLGLGLAAVVVAAVGRYRTSERELAPTSRRG
jgi:uncharacterized repeat protein (TIGR02543 family)